MPRTRAKLLKPTAHNIKLLARHVRNGGIVAVPTETVYGLAADALSGSACEKIFAAKGRPSTDPLIVHLLSVRDLPQVCVANPRALKLARAFWPGPLTLVLPKTSAIPDAVTAGGGSVAVRVPSHPAFRRLLRAVKRPLAAPSANPFGYVSPTTGAHVRDSLGDKIPYILDGGRCSVGVESTIVDLRDAARPALLRPGGVPRRAIERVLGQRLAAKPRARSPGRAQIAPGMLTRHYSPKTKVVLHARLRAAQARATPDAAFVFQAKPAGAASPNIFWLDAVGDERGVARRLFALLRELDQRAFRQLHIELARGEGLAEAINDRLRRAAARR